MLSTYYEGPSLPGATFCLISSFNGFLFNLENFQRIRKVDFKIQSQLNKPFLKNNQREIL